MWVLLVFIAIIVIVVIWSQKQNKGDAAARRIIAAMQPSIARTKRSYILKNLNEDYNLGLTDEQQWEICMSDSPYALLAKYVKPGRPTVMEFLSYFADRMYAILEDDLELSKEEMEEIEDDMAPLLLTVNSQADVDGLAEMFDDFFPSILSCLNGKINYTLPLVSMLEECAQKHNYVSLYNKLLEYRRRKRDYLISLQTVDF